LDVRKFGKIHRIFIYVYPTAQVFQSNLIKEGLELEEDVCDEEIMDLRFIKIHAPIDVCRRYSEILRLRMPMKKVSNFYCRRAYRVSVMSSTFWRRLIWWRSCTRRQINLNLLIVRVLQDYRWFIDWALSGGRWRQKYSITIINCFRRKINISPQFIVETKNTCTYTLQ
jgi:hypothetical protein